MFLAVVAFSCIPSSAFGAVLPSQLTVLQNQRIAVKVALSKPYPYSSITRLAAPSRCQKEYPLRGLSPTLRLMQRTKQHRPPNTSHHSLYRLVLCFAASRVQTLPASDCSSALGSWWCAKLRSGKRWKCGTAAKPRRRSVLPLLLIRQLLLST